MPVVLITVDQLGRAPRENATRPAIVNGTAGLIVPADVGLRAVVGFTVVGGKVTAIDLITDREKLRRLRLS